VRESLTPDSDFRWQNGYAAFTISPDDVPAVERYVLDQKEHHGGRALLSEFEPIDED
jgi:putative transposase